ncbi:hypothetical protein MAMC_00184 [Methylacidimicrobium cyclopophantes]|uniref:Uncharacterized protein n=1 Tax=Methylacidimicrobium cyclopophantes TaxID=1041766 RepID=A0A5E6M8K6_9BACT|nr:hypothetical protein MAMC_00184 [Methylacidimicrobium cyclopophantes]
MGAFGRRIRRSVLRALDLLVFVAFCASMVLLVRSHLGQKRKIVVEGRKGPLWELVSPAEARP